MDEYQHFTGTVPLFSGYMNKHIYVILVLIEEFAVDLGRCFGAESRPTLFLTCGRCIKKKVQFTSEQTTKVQRGSRGITLFFVNFGARWG